ncbi:MAG TPA: tRNA pseudouridine(38-40) synthase TruA [Anaerolineales bacterium]|jgi:tRNA pseudouridine38-40 synthase|nr:tRNA pseudouridine(38-40) synthase TruA [Anaerolineales bacterium]
MVRYKLILAYDGTAFAGSQRQAKHRTVQGELEKALHSLGWAGRSVTLAGRTDTGVHASGQVASFDLDWLHSLEKLRQALNANLPDDMAAKEVVLADAKFHPRFDATSRTYRYRLFCQNVRDPLRERFTWRLWPEFDGERLNQIANVFLGQHDFSAFGSPPREESSTTRTVTLSKWKQVGDEWQYEVGADAFLYRMVRRLVYVQVAVVQGRCFQGTVVKALEKPQTKNEIPAGLAPAHGLTLVEVTY